MLVETVNLLFDVVEKVSTVLNVLYSDMNFSRDVLWIHFSTSVLYKVNYQCSIKDFGIHSYTFA